MLVRPQQWTHHHTHRLFHISVGLCFAFAAIVIAIGMITVWMNAGAVNIDLQPEPVLVTATVSGVNPGPITPIDGGPSGGPITPVSDPTITIVAEPVGQISQQPIVVGGQTYQAYNFSNSHPAFSGQTSISNALVFLYVQGEQGLNSTAQADAQGHWFWQSPVALVPGTYLITATVYNPADLTKYGNASTYFTVNTGTGVPVPLNVPQLPAIPGGTGLNQPGRSVPNVPPAGQKLFGIFFDILSDYKHINAGGKVVASVTLASNYSGKEITNQPISYLVKGSSGEIILETSDIVSFSKQSRFLKTFLTAPGTTPGLYTIVASSTFQGIVSVASDTFYLSPAVATAVINQPMSRQGPVVIWSVLIGLLLLFLLLVFLAYHQTRLLSRAIKEHNERSVYPDKLDDKKDPL